MWTQYRLVHPLDRFDMRRDELEELAGGYSGRIIEALECLEDGDTRGAQLALMGET